MKVRDENRQLTVRHIEADPEFLRVKVTAYKSESPQLGLYRMEIEVPPDAPSCARMGERMGEIRLQTDHPRLPNLQLKVELAVLSGEQERPSLAAR